MLMDNYPFLSQMLDLPLFVPDQHTHKGPQKRKAPAEDDDSGRGSYGFGRPLPAGVEKIDATPAK